MRAAALPCCRAAVLPCVYVCCMPRCARVSRCMRHSGKWVEAPTHNADGSEARVDTVAFPEGGLWLCCGSKQKSGGRTCSFGEHEAPPPPAPVPEGRRLEAATEGAATEDATGEPSKLTTGEVEPAADALPSIN